MKTRLLLLGLALSVIASCAGKTVVQPPAAGGGGAGGTGDANAGGPGGAEPNAGGGGGGAAGAASCETLLADLDQKILAARACTAEETGPSGCDGTAVVVDSCGCGMVVNALEPAAFGAASAASAAAIAAGCVNGCGFDCWTSEATSWSCSPTKTNGWICTPFLGD